MPFFVVVVIAAAVVVIAAVGRRRRKGEAILASEVPISSLCGVVVVHFVAATVARGAVHCSVCVVSCIVL